MKLIDINGKHTKINLEVHLRDWKDALLWTLLTATIIGVVASQTINND